VLDSLSHTEALSRTWGINPEDILLIALNRSGVRSTLDKPRMRFRLRLRSRPETELFLILSLGHEDSPFELDEDEIRFRGEPIADVTGLEDDDAVLGYFRNGRKVLTLNSNARSQCTGCVFCPNTLEAASDPRLAALDDLSAYFSALVEDFELPDMSGIEKVTICTGCFHYEHLAVEHLGAVRAAMTSHGCDGYIHFLSSVLRTEAGLDAAAALGPFHLTLTIECFDRRDVLLKQSKARLMPGEMIDLLRAAGERGIVSDYTYIVGLDSPDVALRWLPLLAEYTTTFPRFQVFQPHTDFMDVFVAKGADDIEYYLAMRKAIERLFVDGPLRPQSWENYRPLWYFTFADEPLSSARI
jgi:hypothetical protein